LGLGRAVIALLVPLFDQIFQDLKECLCNGQNYPNHWAIDIKCLHHSSAVCIRKNIYRCTQGVVLGWVVTASGSIIGVGLGWVVIASGSVI
jgi:hypothetical protein